MNNDLFDLTNNGHSFVKTILGFKEDRKVLSPAFVESTAGANNKLKITKNQLNFIFDLYGAKGEAKSTEKLDPWSYVNDMHLLAQDFQNTVNNVPGYTYMIPDPNAPSGGNFPFDSSALAGQNTMGTPGNMTPSYQHDPAATVP